MDKIKKHVAIFGTCDADASESEYRGAEARGRQRAKAVNDYYRRYAHRFWDFEARGFGLRLTDNPNPPSYGGRDIRKLMEEGGLGDFDPNYYHVIGGISPNGSGGQGMLGGNMSVCYNGSEKTTIHEIGHNMGLHHAADTYNNGLNMVEYGDDTSVMGAHGHNPGFNSAELVLLGLASEREIVNVTKTMQVLLAPIEMDELGMHYNEYQHAIIKKDDKIYNVSTRAISGLRYLIKERKPQIFVHESVPSNKSIHYHPALSVGEELSLPEGIKIQFLEYKDGSARVNIFYNETDHAPLNITIPDGFPVLPSLRPQNKHSGLWYNSNHSGEGLDIHVKDNTLVCYWYTFDVHDTIQKFYFGKCDLNESEEFELYYTEYGSFNTPTDHQVKLAGKARFSLLDDDNAILDFNTTKHGRGAISLVPINKNNSTKSGIYYQDERLGEGFTVQFFDNDESVVALWFTYVVNNKNMFGITTKDAQRWYMLEGSKVNDSEYAFNMYTVVDRMWMEFSTESDAELIGNGTMQIVNTNTLEFTINTPWSEKYNPYRVKRLF